MKLFYQCSDGTIIDFNNDKITPDQPETLLANKWNYKTISGGIGRVKSFYKETVERPLTLDILADDAIEFNQIMSNINKCFDTDIKTVSPGRIYWNDYYKECFICETVPGEYDENFESVKQKLTVLSVCDNWIRESKFDFLEQNAEEVPGAGFEYPYDFTEIDYLISDSVEVIDNSCVCFSDFELRFFGDCTNPSVIIAGHEYELLGLELERGEYAVINSLHKTIKKIDSNGRVENIFHLQNKDSNIFEKIPEGIVSVIRAKNLQVSITIFDERGEPNWI